MPRYHFDSMGTCKLLICYKLLSLHYYKIKGLIAAFFGTLHITDRCLRFFFHFFLCYQRKLLNVLPLWSHVSDFLFLLCILCFQCFDWCDHKSHLWIFKFRQILFSQNFKSKKIHSLYLNSLVIGILLPWCFKGSIKNNKHLLQCSPHVNIQHTVD